MNKFNLKNHKALFSSIAGLTLFSSLFLSKKFRKVAFRQKHYSEVVEKELAEHKKKTGDK